MAKTLERIPSDATLTRLIQQTVRHTVDTLMERLHRIKNAEYQHESDHNEINHLIASRDGLAQFHSWIDSHMGGGKRQRRRSRPYIQQLESLSDSHMQRLEKCGVSLVLDTGKVNMRQHDIRATVPTTDPKQHGDIVEIWRHGYVHADGSVIRPASVVARRFIHSTKQS